MFCKRCGHRRDCHKGVTQATSKCEGFTKRKGMCKCPGFVSPMKERR